MEEEPTPVEVEDPELGDLISRYCQMAAKMRQIRKVRKLNLGRNDICGCGSDRKYKKCCGIAISPRVEHYTKYGLTSGIKETNNIIPAILAATTLAMS